MYFLGKYEVPSLAHEETKNLDLKQESKCSPLSEKAPYAKTANSLFPGTDNSYLM